MSIVLLNDNDSKIIQPTSINIELMNHQKTMIYRMSEIEKNGKININNKETEDMIINTNVGILGDKVGSGKTLMIISLITMNRTIPNNYTDMGGSQYFSYKIKSKVKKLDTNLIIVPHKILPQWIDAFHKYSPNLNIYCISFNKEIDKIIKTKTEIKKNWNDIDVIVETEEIRQELLSEYDVILIGDTMYKRLCKACQNYKFNRIMIDEADTIKLPREMNCHFNFLWLITGTPSGLFYGYKPFINKIFKEDYKHIFNYLIIKNSDDYIEKSIKLPTPKRLKIKCITPKEISLIKDLIPPSILQMINAGNSDQAIKALNCNIDTNDNIFQVITKNLRESISYKEKELTEFKNTVVPYNSKKEQEQKIKFAETMLDKLKIKYEDIKKKIYQLNDDYCPICMSEFTNPVIVSCCNNTFCFDCLAVSLGELHNNKCPYCRQGICKDNIHIISSEKNENTSNIIKNEKYEIKDKLDVLVDLVKKKVDGSFMIFANFMETFSKIEQKLKELDIPYHILKGQALTVKKHIDDFKDKKVRVLMLNANFFGAGMNLQMTTDIIMYHRFNKEMEEQIIGRAQRLGRDIHKPLNVYYLLHENESDYIEDNFKFEDQNNIHYLDWLENANNNTNINTNQLDIGLEEDYIINNENNIKKGKIIIINNDEKNNNININDFEELN